MKERKLSELLRYSLSGSIFVLVLILINPKGLSGSIPGSEFLKGAIGAVSTFVLGALIYSIHRSLMYPLIYRVYLIAFALSKLITFKWDLCIPYRPAETEIEIDVKRWKRQKNRSSFQNKLTEWGSQVHFLYCAAWSLLLGWWVSKKMLPYIQHGKDICINEAWALIMWNVFWITIIGAFIHHYRYLYFEIKIDKKENPTG